MIAFILGTCLALPLWDKRSGFEILFAEKENNNVGVGSFNDWVIDNNTVYVDNSQVFASATPHTVNGDGDVVFEFQSKQYSGDVDFVWGFNQSVMKPSSIWLWKNYTHENYTWGYVEDYGCITISNVTGYTNVGIENYDNYTVCRGNKNNSFLYNVSYQFYDDMDGWVNTSCVYAFSSYNVDGDDYTICGNYNKTIKVWDNQTYFDWKPWNIGYNHIKYNYENMTDWYITPSINIEQGVLYKCKIHIKQLKIQLGNMNGKYWFAFKPSSETISQATNNKHLYYLDPWYNVNWLNRKEITVSNKYGEYTTRLVLFNISGTYNFSGGANNDFSDIRFANSSGDGLIPYWIENYTEDVSCNVWVNNKYNESTLYIYYNNSGASDASNGNETFLFFDDFDDGSIDTNRWDEQTSNVGETDASETGGYLQLERDQDSVEWEGISLRGLTFFDDSCIIQTRVKWTSDSYTQVGSGMCSKNSGYIKDIIDTGTAYDEMCQFYYDRTTETRFYSTSSDGDGSSNANYDSQYADTQSTYVYWKSIWANDSSVDCYTGIDSSCQTLEDHYTSLTPDSGMYPVLILRGRPYNKNIYGYYDWFFVRNYNATEPSFSFGSEETSGCTTSVDTISPYWQDSVSTVSITASTDSGSPDNVTLWYRWSPDNTSWDVGSTAVDEYQYVDPTNTSLTLLEWQTESGTPPYLDADDSSYIHEDKTDSMEEGWFEFTNTSETGIGFNVTFDFLCYGDDGDDGFNIYYDIGGGSTLLDGFVVPLNGGDYGWTTENTGLTLTATQINDLKIMLDTVMVGGGDDIYVDACRIHINRSGTPSGYNWSVWIGSGNPDTGSPWSWVFDCPNESGYYEFYSIGNASGVSESPPGVADALCHVNYSSGVNPVDMPVINFAGSLSSEGGPDKIPLSLTDAPNGYYTSNSQQSNNYIIMNVTCLNATNVKLNYTSNGGSSWTNGSEAFESAGNYWELNLSGITSTGNGFSFDVYAYNTNYYNVTAWQKKDKDNNTVRRWVKLGQTPTSDILDMELLYFYHDDYTEYGHSSWDSDVQYHDQGTDTDNDSGILIDTIPTDSIEYLECTEMVWGWWNKTVCMYPDTLVNVTYHVWIDADVGLDKNSKFRIGKDRDATPDYTIIDYPETWLNYTDAITNITDSLMDGYTYQLFHGTVELDTSYTNLTTNNIYELAIMFYGEDTSNINLFNNRSANSWVIFNIYDNATLQGMDSDSDGLSDYTEIWVTDTNPELSDTDNDSVNDYWENRADSDPNNFWETDNVSWETINDWNGTIFNTSSWNTLLDWNGSIFNNTVFMIIDNWDGTIFNTTNWNTLINWNGSIYNISSWNTINDFNGTLYNISGFNTINDWNGSIYNTSYWSTKNDWNGSIHNITIWNTLVDYNGTIYNTSGWNTLVDYNGTIFNNTVFISVNDWNGTIFNVTSWNSLVDWNGTIYNVSSWNILNDYNGTLYNISGFNTINNWNGTVFNSTVEDWHTINNFNGTIYNITIWNTLNDYNGTIYNVSSWNTLNDYNGSIYNTSSWNNIVDWNGTIGNSTTAIWHTLVDWNGTIFNVTNWNSLVDWNGSVFNVSSWHIINDFNGTIFNTSSWNTLLDWNGTLFNNTIFMIINNWDGTIFNSTNWNTLIDWNGTLWNSTDEWNTLLDWNGSIFNTTGYMIIDNWNGSIYNFTTYFIIISNIYPGNNSYDIPLQPYIYATFNSTIGGVMNISWYYGTSQGYENTLLGTNNNITNSTQNQLFYQASNYSITHYWRIYANDGEHHYNFSYIFTTESDITFIGTGGSGVYAVGAIGVIGILGFIFVFNRRRKQKQDEYDDFYENNRGRRGMI